MFLAVAHLVRRSVSGRGVLTFSDLDIFKCHSEKGFVALPLVILGFFACVYVGVSTVSVH